MKKKLISLVLTLVLVLSCSSMAFASGGDTAEIQPLETDAVVFDIARTSASTADVYIDVHFSQTVDIYNVVVYLQKKVDGEWQIDFSNPERTLYNNGFSKSSFYFFHEYTGLKRGTSYRIWVVSKDTIGTSVHTLSAYSNSF